MTDEAPTSPPARAPSRSKPTSEAPSPLHYWDKVKGAWRLRNGNRKLDDAAEAERLAHLKLEAQLRPPRTGRPPSNEYITMSAKDLIIDINPITGEVLNAPPGEDETLPPASTYEEAAARLGSTGLEEVAGMIEEGRSNLELCARLGIRAGHFNRWIRSTEGAESRVREARAKGAQAWLDRSLKVLHEAQSPMDLAKAREISAVCRKFASIYNPAFSDRVQVDTTVKAEDPTTIDAKLRLIMAQVAQTQVKGPTE